ncbi:uncharacterized protein FFMR_12553 [Fusarium fujikuroi]
MVFSF